MLVFVVVACGAVACNSEILVMTEVIYIRINAFLEKFDHLVHNVKILNSNKLRVLSASADLI